METNRSSQQRNRRSTHTTGRRLLSYSRVLQWTYLVATFLTVRALSSVTNRQSFRCFCCRRHPFSKLSDNISSRTACPSSSLRLSTNRRLSTNSNEEGDSDNNTDKDRYSSSSSSDQSRRIAATGWNHNLPSESSQFWKEPNGLSSSQPSSKGSSTSDRKKPRTGWLHNTQPKQSTSKDGTKSTKSGQGISKAQQRLKQAMKTQEENHRVVEPPAFHACGDGRQVVVTEHRISVPLRYDQKDSSRTDVAFAIVEEISDEPTRQWFESLRAMTPSQRAAAYVEKSNMVNANGCLLFLQGGPGFGSPTPVVSLALGKDSSWGGAALLKYKRLVLMDQRGTGRSTAITKQSLQRRFPDLFILDGKDQSGGIDPKEEEKFQSSLRDAEEYMSCFRADNIVRDAELIREALLQPFETAEDSVPRPWGCSLGQSFGGFCTMTYLSIVDYPPKICLFTGGIAPFNTAAVDVYTSLWEKVKRRNLRYYEMYPGDIPVVKKIVQKLLLEPAILPSGGRLSARRFLQTGVMLGSSPSSFASMHSILSSAFLQPDHTEFSRGFLKTMDSVQPFDEHPIYFWLHESIYADGSKFCPTSWSAEQAFQAKIKTPSEYDYKLTSAMDTDDRPTLFFGEMVFPWMCEDYAECSGVGCVALANGLAAKTDWGQLYDADHMKMVHDTGRTRSAAATYYDDIYVDFDLCMKVTGPDGPLAKTKVFITNEYQHSGLRDDGSTIFTKLHGMATGSVRTPS